MRARLPVLIDASNLHTGGGVQVAASFLNELVHLDPTPPWLADATILCSSQVHENLTSEARRIACRHDATPNLSFLRPARRPQFSVAFTVFGPTYRPRLARREIVGLADPMLPNGYAPPEALVGRTRLQYFKTLVKRARARKVDHAVVESPAYGHALGTIGVHPHEITVVPNSPSASVMTASPRVSRWPLPESGRITLIYPARPYPHKNFDFLGHVAEALATKGRDVTFITTLTAEELTAYSPATQAACIPVGIVTQAQLGELYQAAHAVFFPSLLEVSSATPLEALSLGIPLIAADRDFVHETAGQAAWYFDPRDPHDAASAILRAVAQPDEVKRKVEQGRHLVDNRPNAVDRALRYTELINQHLDEIGQGPRPTVVVAHPAQQHSFRTAEAVATAGYRLRYVTPIYDRPGSLTNRLVRLLHGDARARAASRRSQRLDDDDVVQIYEPVALLLLLLQRFRLSRMPFLVWFRFLVLIFGWKLRRIVEQESAVALISYDTFSAGTFRRLKQTSPQVHLILDMSAPAAPSVDDILESFVENHQGTRAADLLSEERDGFFYQQNTRYAAREIALADHFLAASTFTQMTLKLQGVDPERIHICRYGIDTDPIEPLKHVQSPRPLKVVFLGTLAARKGVADFLMVAKDLQASNFEFVAIGAHDRKKVHVPEDLNVRLTGHVTRPVVNDELATADVIVFPSLADGFGLSVLEAMRSGATAIVSDHAGVSDLIEEGVNGFVVHPGEADLIEHHLKTLERDRHVLARMQRAARATAQGRTWNLYQQELKAALESIIGETQ